MCVNAEKPGTKTRFEFNQSMSPSLALLLWILFSLALLYLDPAKQTRMSFLLWVPVIWIIIMETRLPSQWLTGSVASATQALEEGNPLDRSIYATLILLAIGTLVSRSFSWTAFFSKNVALTAFILFGLVSVCWSDYTFIAFKRWFRDLGNYLVLLVALSDPRPIDAIRAVFRRVYYLLVPLSIVLIKYYPSIGKQYNPWTGLAEYTGATLSKNMLGLLCMFAGLFFFWDTMTRWSNRKEAKTKRIILVNTVFIAQMLWLLQLSHSATSSACFLLGCAVIAMAHSKMSRRLVLTY